MTADSRARECRGAPGLRTSGEALTAPLRAPLVVAPRPLIAVDAPPPDLARTGVLRSSSLTRQAGLNPGVCRVPAYRAGVAQIATAARAFHYPWPSFPGTACAVRRLCLSAGAQGSA